MFGFCPDRTQNGGSHVQNEARNVPKRTRKIKRHGKVYKTLRNL